MPGSEGHWVILQKIFSKQSVTLERTVFLSVVLILPVKVIKGAQRE